MSKITLAKHTYCRNAFRMYKISVIIIICGILFALFQIFYIPQLELNQSDIVKIKIGMDFQEVLDITRLEKNKMIHLFGYGSHRIGQKTKVKERPDTVLTPADNSSFPYIKKYYSDTLQENIDYDGQSIKYKLGLFELNCENRFLSLFNGTQLIVLFNNEFKVVEVRLNQICPDVYQCLYQIEDKSYFEKINQLIK